MRNLCTSMRNRTSQLGAPTLVFSRITIMLFVALLASAAAPKTGPQNSNPAANNDASQEELNWISAGDGRASDGTFLEFYTYKNKKDIRVNLTKGKFTSSSAAQKELSLWLKTATKIIEQGSVKDATGETVGKRAVAFFSESKSHHEYFAILWTNGPKYYWLSSPSLDLARDLENQIAKRGNR